MEATLHHRARDSQKGQWLRAFLRESRRKAGANAHWGAPADAYPQLLGARHSSATLVALQQLDSFCTARRPRFGRYAPCSATRRQGAPLAERLSA
jgi:hypothetical protein